MPYYGTNGFYLPFSDNSTTTALGYDLSGDATSRYNATAVGNAQISTAQSKFGGSSAAFDGAGDSLNMPYSSDLAVGSNNFTIEFWVRLNSVATSQDIIWNGDNIGISASGAAIEIALLSSKFSGRIYSGSTSYIATSSSNATTNTWYHIALVRNSATLTLYVDGSNVASVSVGTASVNNLSELFKIGNYTSATTGGNPLNGYIDDLRFYNGIAKYTANFTPPSTALPTGSADPYWKYCSLAMPMDGTNASTTFPVYKPNSWTPTNFSVTAGTGNDSLIDTPTPYADGSTNRGNYCTFNPIATFGTITNTNATLSNGNLEFTITTTSTEGYYPLTIQLPSSGKYYCEYTLDSFVAGYVASVVLGGEYINTGQKNDGTGATTYGASYTAGDVIGCALDVDTKSVTFYKNGVSQGAFTVVPTGAQSKWYSSGAYLNHSATAGTARWIANFGQRPFQYTPPTGFKALNTYNLP